MINMSKLYGVNDINKALNKWLAENGFKVRVRGLEEDFYWYVNDNTIGYALVCPENSINAWNNLLNELNCQYTIDVFYSSFLHEVFHSETYHMLDTSDLDISNTIKMVINDDPDSFEDIYDTYFHLPVEIAATRAAVKFINSHPDKVQQLIETTSAAIQKFYELNGVE